MNTTKQTRPLLKIRFTKSILIIAIGAILISPLIQTVQKASADQYDDRISALQRQIEAYDAQAAQLHAQSENLQSAIAALQIQAASIQAQIDISQAQYDKLTAQISETEQKIKTNQDALGLTIAKMYVDDKITPIEMLASSKNISEFIDKQEYRSSVRDQLTTTISKIKSLKVQLTKQKDDIKTVLDKHTAEKNSLVATQNQQQDLLSQTQGQESAYQSLIAQAKNQMAADTAARQAYYQSLLKSGGNGSSGVSGNFHYSNWSGNQGCSGGYPYCGPQDSGIDPWGLYNRECVSYVAWALSARFGKYVGNFSGSGNAYEWVWSAPNYSGAVRVSDPQPGDAVILPASPSFSPLGHAMIIESVSGSTIHVSQYNFYGTGEYSTMDIQNSGIVLLRFPNK